MGMATILIMWPGAYEQIFVPPSQGGSMWNLTDWPSSIWEMFEECGRRTTEACLSYKLTDEQSAQVS